jgi:hypothetical protein
VRESYTSATNVGKILIVSVRVPHRLGQQGRGRPDNERLVLRTLTHTKRALEDIGEEALTTVEAWPLGVDLKQRPLYSVKVEGEDCRTVESALFVISRGLEEVEWWSAYKLGSGEHLFDTYVPLVHFSSARDILTPRCVGLAVPADDEADTKRLRDPDAVEETVTVTIPIAGDDLDRPHAQSPAGLHVQFWKR